MRKKVIMLVVSCLLLSQICCGCSITENDETRLSSDVVDEDVNDETEDIRNDTEATSTKEETQKSENDYSEYANYPSLSIQYLNYYLQSRGIHEQGFSIDLSDYMQGEAVYIKCESKFFGEDYYARTNSTTSLIYYGDYKDNKPDGVGALGMMVDVTVELNSESGNYVLTYERLSESTEESNMAFVVSYIGEFSEGRFSGTGYYFESPLIYNDSEQRVSYEISPEEYTLCDGNYQMLLSMCANPIIYIGEFSEGYYNGMGMKIVHYVWTFDEENLDTSKEKNIWIGNFEDGELCGKALEYRMGKLLYEGEYSHDEFYGNGILYNPDTGKVIYKGGFIAGKYDGQGTLYDENGEVIYSGEWDMGDYAN